MFWALPLANVLPSCLIWRSRPWTWGNKPSFGESFEEVCPSSPAGITEEGIPMVRKAYLPFSDPESTPWLLASSAKFIASPCPLQPLCSTQGRKMISGSQGPSCAKLSRSQSTGWIIYMPRQPHALYLWDWEPHCHLSSSAAPRVTPPGLFKWEVIGTP